MELEQKLGTDDVAEPLEIPPAPGPTDFGGSLTMDSGLAQVQQQLAVLQASCSDPGVLADVLLHLSLSLKQRYLVRIQEFPLIAFFAHLPVDAQLSIIQMLNLDAVIALSKTCRFWFCWLRKHGIFELLRSHLGSFYAVGDCLDAKDDRGKWYGARVLDRTDDAIYVHYMGWGSRWDEWISHDDVARLSPWRTQPRSLTPAERREQQQQQRVLVLLAVDPALQQQQQQQQPFPEDPPGDPEPEAEGPEDDALDPQAEADADAPGRIPGHPPRRPPPPLRGPRPARAAAEAGLMGDGGAEDILQGLERLGLHMAEPLQILLGLGMLMEEGAAARQQLAARRAQAGDAADDGAGAPERDEHWEQARPPAPPRRWPAPPPPPLRAPPRAPRPRLWDDEPGTPVSRSSSDNRSGSDSDSEVGGREGEHDSDTEDDDGAGLEQPMARWRPAAAAVPVAVAVDSESSSEDEAADLIPPPQPVARAAAAAEVNPNNARRREGWFGGMLRRLRRHAP